MSMKKSGYLKDYNIVCITRLQYGSAHDTNKDEYNTSSIKNKSESQPGIHVTINLLLNQPIRKYMVIDYKKTPIVYYYNHYYYFRINTNDKKFISTLPLNYNAIYTTI